MPTPSEPSSSQRFVHSPASKHVQPIVVPTASFYGSRMPAIAPSSFYGSSSKPSAEPKREPVSKRSGTASLGSIPSSTSSSLATPRKRKPSTVIDSPRAKRLHLPPNPASVIESGSSSSSRATLPDASSDVSTPSTVDSFSDHQEASGALPTVSRANTSVPKPAKKQSFYIELPRLGDVRTTHSQKSGDTEMLDLGGDRYKPPSTSSAPETKISARKAGGDARGVSDLL
jgi:hypothetical protein